jgi:HK97 family phage portal protein
MACGASVDKPISKVEPIEKAIQPMQTGITNRPGFGLVGMYDNNVYKTTIPQFLYSLPYGYPRYIDVTEIRRLSKTPYARMCIQTIIDEVCAVKWDIVPRFKETANSPAVQAHIEEVKAFFENPNSNDESFEQVRRKYLDDLVTLDSGVVNKIFSTSAKFTEIYAIDGGSVNRNPNIYGNFVDRADIVSPFFERKLLRDANNKKEAKALDMAYANTISGMENPPAYFQYGYTNASRPVPLGRREIIYMMRAPNTYSHYGLSPMETLMDIIQMLLYGITHNLEIFTKDYVPKGFLASIGMTTDECKAFGDRLKEQMKYKDIAGNIVKKQWEIPIIGFDGKYIRTQYTPEELQLITQQEWFIKIVWAAFGITPSEAGFTEDSNRATEIGQNEVFRRKTIRPILTTEEYALNTQLVWQEFYDDVMFKFDMYDVKEDKEKHELYEIKLRNGIATPNEIREELGKEPIEGGDDIQSRSAFPGSYQENDDKDNQDDYEKNVKENKSIDIEPTPENLEKVMVKIIDVSEDIVKSILAESIPKANVLKAVVMKSKPESDIVAKAFGDEFITKIMAVLGFDSIRSLVNDTIRRQYSEGAEKVEKIASFNFMPNKNAIEFLQNYTFDNIKGMTKEIADDLRAELQRGLMNNEGLTKLTKRVGNVFDNAENRAKVIARTETSRAFNYGNVAAFDQSPLDGKKKWVSKIDSKTSEACHSLNGKMVNKGENFKYKDWEGPASPQHPNCRSRIDIVLVTE